MNISQPYSLVIAETYDDDTWYSNYNYAKNTEGIMELLGEASNKSILELASGTGSYLHTFSAYYERVLGLELSPYMRDISLKKYPHLPVHLGNMADFALPETFDTIALLCGTIGSLSQKTEEETWKVIRDLIRCSRKHLKPNGNFVLETYDQPDTIHEWVLTNQYDLEDKFISYHTVKTIESNRLAVLNKHFLVTPKLPKGKTTYTNEKYYLCTFTAEELISLFAEEGFRVKAHIPSFAVEGRDLIIFELSSNT